MLFIFYDNHHHHYYYYYIKWSYSHFRYWTFWHVRGTFHVRGTYPTVLESSLRHQCAIAHRIMLYVIPFGIAVLPSLAESCRVLLGLVEYWRVLSSTVESCRVLSALRGEKEIFATVSPKIMQKPKH